MRLDSSSPNPPPESDPGRGPGQSFWSRLRSGLPAPLDLLLAISYAILRNGQAGERIRAEREETPEAVEPPEMKDEAPTASWPTPALGQDGETLASGSTPSPQPAPLPGLPFLESSIQGRGSILALGPRKLAILAAALEDLGVSQEGIGFELAFGRCVSDGDRESECKVEGVGLAALSRYLAQWFKENGKADFPLQVVDDGSGEIKIFVSSEG